MKHLFGAMKNNSRTLTLSVSLLAAALLFIPSCKKTESVPHNPYEDIVRGDTTSFGIPLDSLNITYIHKKILAPTCAVPGCHVGNFEPDFRTPQSSFSTMVYAAVKKNNPANPFKYRVIPNDTNGSLLYERLTNCCFINQNDRMPQDSIGVPLSNANLNLIASWIMHGARDIFGNTMAQPDAEPVVSPLYVAISTNFQTVYSATRLDSVVYNPFVVPLSVTSFLVGIKASDDLTSMFNLKYNQLKISAKEDDFSNATSYTAAYTTFGTDSYLVATVLPSLLPANDTLFMRYYVNDGRHTNNTEYPRTETEFYYKRFWSFIRK